MAKEKTKNAEEFCVTKRRVKYTPRQILLWWWNEGIWDGRGMWKAWERREIHKTILVGKS